MRVLIVAKNQTALVEVVALLKQAGIDASGSADNQDAMTQLQPGTVAALVIDGGADDSSKLRLQYVAERMGTNVIDGALRPGDLEAYVRDELLPALRRIK